MCVGNGSSLSGAGTCPYASQALGNPACVSACTGGDTYATPAVGSALANARIAAQVAVAAELALNTSLTTMRQVANTVLLSNAVLKNNATWIQNNLNAIQTLVNPLFGYTNQFMNVAYCGFVGTTYQNIKQAVCGDITSGYVCVGCVIVFVCVCVCVRVRTMEKVRARDTKREREREREFTYVERGTD